VILPKIEELSVTNVDSYQDNPQIKSATILPIPIYDPDSTALKKLASIL
jgi:hypothetical protein